MKGITGKDLAEWAQRTGNAALLVTRKTSKPAHVPHEMNNLERAFAGRLKLQWLAGEIVAFCFEPFPLRLAPRTEYNPDFLVLTLSGRGEFYETKGAKVWEDSVVKLKVAAAMFPMFDFFLVKRVDGDWKIKPVPKT